MKTLVLWGALALAPFGLVIPVHAQDVPDLIGAPVKWPTINHRDNQRVVAIQYLLRARGFYKARADGIYGPKTVAAVKGFQRKSGLKVDGVAGPQILPKLVLTVQRGSHGDAVRAAQTLVWNTLDYVQGMPYTRLPIDGMFGVQTERAVAFAQTAYPTRDREKRMKQDGIMGPRTWCLLLGGQVIGSHYSDY